MFPKIKRKCRAAFSFFMILWSFICFLFKRRVRAMIQYEPIRYKCMPLTPIARHRLNIVPRKILVLDLDETLIHSHFATPRNAKITTPKSFDFSVIVSIARQPVRCFVNKRPHVDFFLDCVSQWFDVVLYTASVQGYSAPIVDRLENGRRIFQERYFRQDCTILFGTHTKDLRAICPDLDRIFIIDNSPFAYRRFRNNAIPIKSWFSNPRDIALLSLLPVLDALRFTKDVRSLLSRNLHLHHHW